MIGTLILKGMVPQMTHTQAVAALTAVMFFLITLGVLINFGRKR
jgi:hypothetical protein